MFQDAIGDFGSWSHPMRTILLFSLSQQVFNKCVLLVLFFGISLNPPIPPMAGPPNAIGSCCTHHLWFCFPLKCT